MDEFLFTPSAVLGLLTQIDELSDKDISFDEKDDSLVITVGTTQYIIQNEGAENIEVSEDIIEDVSEVNQEGYEKLVEDGVEFSYGRIEGGIIKELAKNMLLGGMIRLTNKWMAKDQFDAFTKQADKYRKKH